MGVDPLQTAGSFAEALSLYTNNNELQVPTDIPADGIPLANYLDPVILGQFEARMGSNTQLRGEWLQAKAAVDFLQTTVNSMGTDPDPLTISAAEFRLLSAESQADVLLALGVLQLFAESTSSQSQVEVLATEGNYYRADPLNLVITRPENSEPVEATLRFVSGGPEHTITVTLQPGQNEIEFLAAGKARELANGMPRRRWSGAIEVVVADEGTVTTDNVVLRGSGGAGYRTMPPPL